MLADAGAELDAVDDRGSSALHKACGNDSGDLARVLIVRGANVRLADGKGETALDIALAHGAQSAALAILEHGPGLEGAELAEAWAKACMSARSNDRVKEKLRALGEAHALGKSLAAASAEASSRGRPRM
jgi:ankyrin repeat protein